MILAFHCLDPAAILPLQGVIQILPGLKLALAAERENEDVDVRASTTRGRDYLRTTRGSGPGIAVSLLALQVSLTPFFPVPSSVAHTWTPNIQSDYCRSTESSASSSEVASLPVAYIKDKLTLLTQMQCL